MSLAPSDTTVLTSLSDLELRQINKLTDKQAASLPDDIICAAAVKSWKSTSYNHYNVSLERRINKDGLMEMWFIFTCKTNPSNHPAQQRARRSTSSGTNSLLRTLTTCNVRNKTEHEVVASSRATREFSSARFRALLALWASRNHRPYELVHDDLFVAMISELRPDTSLPDPTTISRDVKRLYTRNVESMRRYFEQIDHVHLAVDGWTAPTSRSYLGLVILWQNFGLLHRAILEFVQLTGRHTGQNLAEKTAECLHKYNLGPKLLSACMDNASNNNTFTQELQKRIPTFGGSEFRTRCVAHILNLMAKAYLSVFSKPATRKRAGVTKSVATPPSKRHRIKNDPDQDALKSSDPELPQPLELADAGNESDSDTDEAPTDDIDEDKLEHDNATVKASVVAAFAEMEKKHGLHIPHTNRQSAQELLTKVTGLANRAKKSTIVQQKFEHYVAAVPGLSRSPHPALTCSVSTRWNTELLSLQDHVQKRPAIQPLTADRDLSLKRYHLDDAQWVLAEQLVLELKAFERLTLLFSETQVPLIHQVIPALLKLQERLQATVNNSAPSFNPIFRVAAYASLKVFDKYMSLFEDSSLYWVALVMCPHKKLEWFRKHRYSESDVQRIEILTYSAFDKMSRTWVGELAELQQSDKSAPEGLNQILDSDWLSDDELEPTVTATHKDTLADYLKAPLVSIETLRQGGLLAYWEKQRKYSPRLARFALNILSAPASSVDAERAFSGGRLTINHLQHAMGDTTFEAKMAVGSWYGTPLLPSVDVAAEIIGEKLRH